MYPEIKSAQEKIKYFWGTGKDNQPLTFNQYLSALRLRHCNKNCVINKIEGKLSELAKLQDDHFVMTV
ncbi:hypothetical protein ACGVWS_03805 [Enterobacteriaceae bacterium LUAb1]